MCAALNPDKRETLLQALAWFLFGLFSTDPRSNSGWGLKWVGKLDEVMDFLLGAQWSSWSIQFHTEEGTGVGDTGEELALWRYADLEHGLCASDLKNLLFSMLAMSWRKGKITSLSAKRQTGTSYPSLLYSFQNIRYKFLNIQTASCSILVV